MGDIHFTKMSATGNDFIVIDNRSGILNCDRDKEFLSRICQRKVSVGADGVILLESSKRCDFKYVHMNSDGSIAEMCGNGSRAISYFAHSKGIVAQNAKFEILGKIYQVKINGNMVTTDFNSPVDQKFNLGIVSESYLQEGGFINSGVPHLVLFVKDVNAVDVANIGRKYRHQKEFSEGTNVDFVQVERSNFLKVRTFERGVEGETLACGTGAVASAIISNKKGLTTPPITVQYAGGELGIDFKKNFKNITLTGKVDLIYTGIIHFT